IGPNTSTTMPPATLDAYRDHGKLHDRLEQDVDDAQRVLGELNRVGISLDAVTDKLVEEGVRLFADAADSLLAAVAGKRAALLGDRLDKQTIALAPRLETTAGQAIADWRAQGNVRRLFEHDKSLWTNADEDQWLGWLDSVDASLAQIGRYETFAADVKRAQFTDALVLGMGGSSLGPEVLARTFGHRRGW